MKCKNTWIYCRVAYPENMALAMQKERLIEYARANGMTVCGVIAEASSGTTLSRVGLNEINSKIENGKIHSLLVKDITRLGRDMLKVLNYIEWLNEKGVELICADGSTSNDCIFDDFTNQMRDIVSRKG